MATIKEKSILTAIPQHLMNFQVNNLETSLNQFKFIKQFSFDTAAWVAKSETEVQLLKTAQHLPDLHPIMARSPAIRLEKKQRWCDGQSKPQRWQH